MISEKSNPRLDETIMRRLLHDYLLGYGPDLIRYHLVKTLNSKDDLEDLIGVLLFFIQNNTLNVIRFKDKGQIFIDIEPTWPDDWVINL
jgi:hypothetical protein